MRRITWLAVSILLVALITLGVVGERKGWFDSLKQRFFEQLSALSSDDESRRIPLESFTLSNGMQVILLPNSRVPAVSHMLWLRAGAADDPYGKSGLAHYLEHLMFKGTKAHPNDAYSRRIEALGGEFNAFTSNDFTGYYVNIARIHLETIMQIEADRLRHLAPTDDNYRTELNVILEERYSRIDSDPEALWEEQMQAALFVHHPYRIPVIGWRHEMEQLTKADAEAFYTKHYHAGNLVLVVAGDISRSDLEPMAERYYGALPAPPANTRAWTQEPPAIAARSVTFEHEEVTSPRWQRRYLAASYGNKNAPSQQIMALSLLSQWLGGGKLGLLYQQLVEQLAIAVSVNTDYSGLSHGPGQFIITAQPSQGVSLEKLEAAIDDVVASAQRQIIAEDDLKRIKSLYRASATYARDGLSGLAQYAGYLSMLNVPLDYLTQWEQHVEAVTAQDIHQAALTLQSNIAVTGYLLPKPKPQAQPAQEPSHEPK